MIYSNTKFVAIDYKLKYGETMPNIYPFKYARAIKTEEHFPLWEVQMVKNWNFKRTIVKVGEFQTIRLFNTKSAASLFADLINASLTGIPDVAE